MTLQQHESMNNLTGPALDEQSFQKIAVFAYKTAGLSISPTKSAMVRTRLARRLRALKLNSFDEYCAYFQSPGGESEQTELISALTTNVSHFFREKHHFELLKDKIVPDLLQPTALTRPLRFWSAGCSNGQEPLSLAITLQECGLVDQAKDLKILATDIDPRVVQFARTSEYPERMLEGLPPHLLKKYFSPVAQDGPETIWKSHVSLSRLIAFRRLNLLENWPMTGTFDVIFCRNVVIYFDQPTQDKLWERFSNILRPGGVLFLGHSERVSDEFQNNFESLGGTAYRRLA